VRGMIKDEMARAVTKDEDNIDPAAAVRLFRKAA